MDLLGGGQPLADRWGELIYLNKNHLRKCDATGKGTPSRHNPAVPDSLLSRPGWSWGGTRRRPSIAQRPFPLIALLLPSAGRDEELLRSRNPEGGGLSAGRGGPCGLETVPARQRLPGTVMAAGTEGKGASPVPPRPRWARAWPCPSPALGAVAMGTAWGCGLVGGGTRSRSGWARPCPALPRRAAGGRSRRGGSLPQLSGLGKAVSVGRGVGEARAGGPGLGEAARPCQGLSGRRAK